MIDFSGREIAGQRCPGCRRVTMVLADELGQHACAWCGYDGHDEREPEPEDEEEDE